MEEAEGDEDSLMNNLLHKLLLTVLISSFVYAATSFAVEPQTTPASPAVQEKQIENMDVKIGKIVQVPFTARSRRDPFASIIITTKKKMKEHAKKQNPLENFDVTDFKIMGIIFDGKRYYASVVLPDNKAYTLRAGLKVGLFGGKVEKITNDAIIIKEYITDYLGKKKLKTTALKLRKEEEQ